MGEYAKAERVKQNHKRFCSINTIRLWLPQIFVAITNYQNEHNGDSSSLCEMLSLVQPNVTYVDGEKVCEVVSDYKIFFLFLLIRFFQDVSSISPYVNSIIVSIVGIIGYLLATVIINKVRKKVLLGTQELIER